MKAKLVVLFLILFSEVLFAQEINDKIFYSDSLHQKATADNYFTKTIVKDYFLDKPEYKYLEYYKSGSLKSEKTISGKDGGHPIGEEINYYENGNKKNSSFYEDKKQNGKYTEWYENGKLREEGIYDAYKFGTKEHYLVTTVWGENGNKSVENGTGQYQADYGAFHVKGEYKNGLKDGIWIKTTLKNPIKSYMDEYKDGEFIHGYSIDENGYRSDYTALEKRPEPKKGLKDFYGYISSNFKATHQSVLNKAKGRILLSFVVEKDGKINDIKIISGLGYGLDEEAIRVLKSYDDWIPGEQLGQKVRCLYSLPIVLDFSK